MGSETFALLCFCQIFKLLELPWTRIGCVDHKIDLCIHDMDPKPPREAKPQTALKAAKPARGPKAGCAAWQLIWAPVAALNARFARSGKVLRALKRAWEARFPAEPALLPVFAALTRWCTRFLVIVRTMEMWFVGETVSP